MSLAQPYIDHIKDISQSKIDLWAEEAILENAGKIVNLVKYGQLSKGLNSLGKPLAWSDGTGFYARATQAFANRDNVGVPKPFGAPYNFSWSGETLDNMFLERVDEKKHTFQIETKKAKQTYLENIYGEIFDLTEENNKWVNDNIILPYIHNKILENMFNI